jgi:hypothetical protein
MTPTEAGTWVQFLRDAGGWGLSVVEAGVIWYLWRELKAKDLRLFTLLDRTNEILAALQRRDTPRALPSPEVRP